MDLNIPGIIVLIVFYLVVLIVGFVAAKKFKTDGSESDTERQVVAGRNLNVIVGIFTMTATTVGGGYLNGTAESVASMGIWWTLAPFGIFVGLIIGGLFFAEHMRKKRYLTMLDPFQDRYGEGMVALLYVAAIFGDVFWSASVLSALGTSISVMIGLDVVVAVVISALVGVIYTLFGQMIAVAYTDIVQLILIASGLIITTPFVLTDSRMGPLMNSSAQWLGKPDSQSSAVWADLAIAMTMGTIPWQAYFQRVLSMQSASSARLLSIFGGLGAFLLAIPPAFIGIAATAANWTATDLGKSPLDTGKSSLVLPLTIYHFSPNVVTILGLGAISAAVMSSVDSAILGSSSMFTHNIYKVLIRKKASDSELAWIQRISVFFVGAISTCMAIFVKSIYGLFILAADFVFVVIFPQLCCVIYFKFTNTYGAVTGYIIAVLLRIGAGEPVLSLPAFITYPFYQNGTQYFPFRTFAMAIAFTLIICVSLVTNTLFEKYLSYKLDIFKCCHPVYRNGQVRTEDIAHQSQSTIQQNHVLISHSNSIANSNYGLETSLPGDEQLWDETTTSQNGSYHSMRQSDL